MSEALRDHIENKSFPSAASRARARTSPALSMRRSIRSVIYDDLLEPGDCSADEQPDGLDWVRGKQPAERLELALHNGGLLPLLRLRHAPISLNRHQLASAPRATQD